MFNINGTTDSSGSSGTTWIIVFSLILVSCCLCSSGIIAFVSYNMLYLFPNPPSSAPQVFTYAPAKTPAPVFNLAPESTDGMIPNTNQWTYIVNVPCSPQGPSLLSVDGRASKGTEQIAFSWCNNSLSDAQLWRFIPVRTINSGYKIQNKLTGLYLSTSTSNPSWISNGKATTAAQWMGVSAGDSIICPYVSAKDEIWIIAPTNSDGTGSTYSIQSNVAKNNGAWSFLNEISCTTPPAPTLPRSSYLFFWNDAGGSIWRFVPQKGADVSTLASSSC
jgi:hypothetical protein